MRTKSYTMSIEGSNTMDGLFETRTVKILNACYPFGFQRIHLGLCAEGVRQLFRNVKPATRKIRVTVRPLNRDKPERYFRLPHGSNCIQVHDKWGRMRTRKMLLENIGAFIRGNMGFDAFCVDVEVLK